MKHLFKALTVALLFPALAHAQDDKYFSLSTADAALAVSQALADKGAGHKISASINGHASDTLFSHDKPIAVSVRGLKYDAQAAQWSASLLAVSGDNVITALPASGRYEEIAEVPVLKRQLRNGETISMNDLEIRDFPIGRTRSDGITDISDLVGKSPVKTISAFRPIRLHEIAEPSIIAKNAMVSMHYNTAGMSITTTGQAMEEGARGQMISVKNLTSKKVVRAIIEDASTVRVGPAPKTEGVPYAAN